MTEVTPQPLAVNVAAATTHPAALLALGIPRCPACMLLPASLAAIVRARPGVWVGLSLFASPADWEQREHLLWPRGVHVSRSAVPVVALFIDGELRATRPGGAPAYVLDAWIAETLGPPDRPLDAEVTTDEAAAATSVAARRTQHQAVKTRDLRV